MQQCTISRDIIRLFHLSSILTSNLFCLYPPILH
nr:MAG TPA: hypothetical protein [Caudoviricetes sp.]